MVWLVQLKQARASWPLSKWLFSGNEGQSPKSPMQMQIQKQVGFVHINFAWCKKPPDFKPPLASFESKKVIIEPQLLRFDSTCYQILCESCVELIVRQHLYSTLLDSQGHFQFFHSASLPLHNVLFVQYLFLATERGGTWPHTSQLWYHSTYFNPNSFGCEENTFMNVFVSFKL